MSWKNAVLALGLLHMALGAIALAAPARIAGFIGIGLETASSRGEIRAVFGGLVLVLGALMVAALRRHEGPAWLRALACGFGGLVVGRGVSLLADGITAYTVVAALLESATAAVLAIAARSLDERPAGTGAPEPSGGRDAARSR